MSHADELIAVIDFQARSPGYNIITGHDVLSGKTAEEIQTIYASALKPSKPAH